MIELLSLQNPNKIYIVNLKDICISETKDPLIYIQNIQRQRQHDLPGNLYTTNYTG